MEWRCMEGRVGEGGWFQRDGEGITIAWAA